MMIIVTIINDKNNNSDVNEATTCEAEAKAKAEAVTHEAGAKFTKLRFETSKK